MLKWATAFLLFAFLLHCSASNVAETSPAPPAPKKMVVQPPPPDTDPPAEPSPSPAISPDALLDPAANPQCDTSGELPTLDVTTNGRQVTVNDARESTSSGQLYVVDWREDPASTHDPNFDGTDPSAPTQGRTHTYALPGTYNILFEQDESSVGGGVHPLALRTVTIPGPKDAAGTELEITGPVNGDKIDPRRLWVQWNWAPVKQLAMDIALLDGDGTHVLATQPICSAAYVGHGRYIFEFSKQGPPVVPSSIQVRIRLWDNHLPVLERKSTITGLQVPP